MLDGEYNCVKLTHDVYEIRGRVVSLRFSFPHSPEDKIYKIYTSKHIIIMIYLSRCTQSLWPGCGKEVRPDVHLGVVSQALLLADWLSCLLVMPGNLFSLFQFFFFKYVSCELDQLKGRYSYLQAA